MATLYPIVDLETLERLGLHLEPVLAALLGEGPRWLQVRAKGSTDRAFVKALETALRVRSDLAGCPTRIIVNDRPDLAVLTGCDGVHVGQDDAALCDVRSYAPQLLVGVSTHDIAQLQRALAQLPDYVALGPIFPTGTKSDAAPAVGMSVLCEASELCFAARIPLVAIGGIDEGSLAQVGACCEAVSVIGALLGALGDGAADEVQPALHRRYRSLAACLGGGAASALPRASPQERGRVRRSPQALVGRGR